MFFLIKVNISNISRKIKINTKLTTVYIHKILNNTGDTSHHLKLYGFITRISHSLNSVSSDGRFTLPITKDLGIPKYRGLMFNTSYTIF